MKALRPHQEHGISELRKSLARGNNTPLLQSPTGSGKCLGIGTPVLMADGTVKPVEQILVGDRLASPTGGFRTVLSLARGREELYKVTPVKGMAYVVNASHILSLKKTGGEGTLLSDGQKVNPSQDIVNVRADVFKASSKNAHHLLKGWRSPVARFEGENAELSIPPYILGAWLGDGHKGKPTISKPDGPIVQSWIDYGASLGVAYYSSDFDRCPFWRLTNGKNGGGKNPVTAALEKAGVLHNKHVPQIYLSSTWDNRLELLAGLMDTDGHTSRGGYDFISKDKQLSESVCFLARSVGLAAYLIECTKGIKSTEFYGNYWRVSISGDCSIIPCKQKKALPRLQKKRVLVTGIDLISIGEGDYYGFELDGDRLFMLGDFTVTHNTVLAANIIRMAREKGKRVCFCVPAISLINQTVEEFYKEGLHGIGVIQSDHPMKDYSKPVQIASIQTIQARGLDRIPDFDLVIVDEAHRMFKVIGEWIGKGGKFIGLSATPWAKGLGKLYDDLIIGSTVKDLIAQGYLSDFRVFAPSHPDLTGVKTTAGDYNQKQLGEVMNDNRLVSDVVTTWLKLGEQQPTLCFAVDRAHAKALQGQFEHAGVGCGYIDAHTDSVERKFIENQLHRGEIKVVCNVGCLTTGVDWDVRCIILARPTRSEMLFVQMIGRGLRTAEGKADCIILDHADNHARMGFVSDIGYLTLDGGPKATAAKKEIVIKEALPKECPKCSFLKQPKVSECPNCKFTPERISEIEVEVGDLIAVRGKAKVATTEEKQRFWSSLLSIANSRGRSRGWASHTYRDRFSVWPVKLSDTPIPPHPDVASYVRAKDIRYAKRKSA